jgi:hypothetical protein
MCAAMAELDPKELATRFMALVEPELHRYWKSEAVALTTPALDDSRRAMGTARGPLLAHDDLIVMVRARRDGTADLWAWTTAEYRLVYVRLEAEGRSVDGRFFDVRISGSDADRWEGRAINGGVDKQEALEGEGFEIALTPGEDD